jgi:hypothetical protein
MKFFVLVSMMLAGCTDDGGPRLATVVPASTNPGGMVTLSGMRLCGAHGDCATAGGEVLIGLAQPGILAQIVTYADDHAVIEIPSLTPAGATFLSVTVDDQASNALAFEVL